MIHLLTLASIYFNLNHVLYFFIFSSNIYHLSPVFWWLHFNGFKLLSHSEVLPKPGIFISKNYMQLWVEKLKTSRSQRHILINWISWKNKSTYLDQTLSLPNVWECSCFLCLSLLEEKYAFCQVKSMDQQSQNWLLKVVNSKN